MATQGELMACVILTAFAGLLIWYAQDEKKTANTGGMEDLEMDDLERARELLHYLATTKSAGKNALAYREKLDEFLRLIYQDMPMGEEVEAQRHVQA